MKATHAPSHSASRARYSRCEQFLVRCEEIRPHAALRAARASGQRNCLSQQLQLACPMGQVENWLDLGRFAFADYQLQSIRRRQIGLAALSSPHPSCQQGLWPAAPPPRSGSATALLGREQDAVTVVTHDIRVRHSIHQCRGQVHQAAPELHMGELGREGGRRPSV
jgi:hypothetical protein